MNELFPVFLKLHQLKLLIVGGGFVGLEKVTAVLENSPKADVTLIAPEIRAEILALADEFPNLKLVHKAFEINDLDDRDLVIVATNFKDINRDIKRLAKARRILTNVADTPDECDFYLGSIVRKGSLKLAISTNGKSPTVAKRLREVLTDALPDELDELLENIRNIRLSLSGDFAEKVRQLNHITKSLSE